MKNYRIYLAFIVLIISINAYCQPEVPETTFKKTLVEGRRWEMLIKYFARDMVEWNYTKKGDLSLQGDTIINGIPCKKFSSGEYFAVYENQGRVYGFYKDFSGPTVSVVDRELFNYHHYLGEKVVLEKVDGLHYMGDVIVADTIEVVGEKRKRIVIHRGENYADSASYKIIVEGIGVTSDTYYRMQFPDHYFDLTAVYDNGECIFTKADFWKGINLSAVVDVADFAREDDKCYDIFGRVVAEPVNGQLLIKNGKKFIYRE